MHHAAILSVVLFLTLESSVRSQCTPQENANATLLTASFNASNTITFDNLGLAIEVEDMGGLTVSIKLDPFRHRSINRFCCRDPISTPEILASCLLVPRHA